MIKRKLVGTLWCGLLLCLCTFPSPAHSQSPEIKILDERGKIVQRVSELAEAALWLRDGYSVEIGTGTHGGQLEVARHDITLYGAGTAVLAGRLSVAGGVNNFALQGVSVTGTVALEEGKGHRVERCAFSAAGALILDGRVREVTVHSNTFRGGRLELRRAGGTVLIRNNSFTGMARVDLAPAFNGRVDAALNYWGSRSGPVLPGVFQSYQPGGITVHNFRGQAALQPWLDAEPDGGGKAVFAVLNVNSGRYYWSLSGDLLGGESDRTGALEEAAPGDKILLGPFTFREKSSTVWEEQSVHPAVVLQQPLHLAGQGRDSIIEGTVVAGDEAGSGSLEVNLSNLRIDAAGNRAGICARGAKERPLNLALRQVEIINPAVAAIVASSPQGGGGEDNAPAALLVEALNCRLETGRSPSIEGGQVNYAAGVYAAGGNTSLNIMGSTFVKKGRDLIAAGEGGNESELRVAVLLDGGAHLPGFIGNSFMSAAGVRRLYGADRYKTAAAISKEWASSRTVLLARGDDFADALSGVPLAAELAAPILLTPPHRLLPETLQRLGPTGLNASRVIILGGPGAIATAVEEELRSKGFEVERLAGNNRHATAAEVARRLAQENAAYAGNTALLVRSDDFTDALAAGPWAFRLKAPLLPVGKNGALPPEVLEYIQSARFTEFYLVGGEEAVPNSAADRLLELPATRDVQRLHGSNRFSTAVKLAEQAAWPAEQENGPALKIFLARSDNFADALSGGALACREGGVILLTPPEVLHKETRAFLGRPEWREAETVILGGPGAVSEGVAAAVNVVSFIQVRRIN